MCYLVSLVRAPCAGYQALLRTCHVPGVTVSAPSLAPGVAGPPRLVAQPHPAHKLRGAGDREHTPGCRAVETLRTCDSAGAGGELTPAR